MARTTYQVVFLRPNGVEALGPCFFTREDAVQFGHDVVDGPGYGVTPRGRIVRNNGRFFDFSVHQNGSVTT